MKVPQLQVIDEVAKVPRSMRRQVPMIQEMQKDQNPVQISFKVHDIPELETGCTTLSPYLKGRTDKAEVQKDKNGSR